MNVGQIKYDLRAARKQKGTVFFQCPDTMAQPEVKIFDQKFRVTEFDYKITLSRSSTTGEAFDLLRLAERKLWGSVKGVVTYRGSFWRQLDSDIWIARLSVTDLNGRHMIAPNKWSADIAEVL